MSDVCPICSSPLNVDQGQYPPKTGDRRYFECPKCGGYSLSRSLADDMASILREDSKKIAVLSHSIRKMQKNSSWPYIDSYLAPQILRNSLPTLSEQIGNMILWLGDKTSPGRGEWLEPSRHQSIMGAETPEGFGLVIKRLINLGFIEGEISSGLDGIIQLEAVLTFDGWNYYDQLHRGAFYSRRVFMAMKYGDPDLDQIVNEFFRPAVAATGFELYRLDEVPKAGLIDDRLRVEIRTSKFLISDLTHENAGAYWEAGFAEGLGKPVIYTCEKSKFESQKTHFDTNHHLTVIWDKENLQLAVEQLKATIRATLPDEAKLTDE